MSAPLAELKLQATQAAIEAIRACDASQTQKMIVGPYVDNWIARFLEEDMKYLHVIVESPFFIVVEESPATVIVGVVDDSILVGAQLVGREWKTCKAPKQNKGGGDSAWWNEGVWLEEIREGAQIETYAMAMKWGSFLVQGLGEGQGDQLVKLEVETPQIQVRAMVKDTPPRVWPTNPVNGLFVFNEKQLEYARNAYLVKAAKVRAMRRSGLIPWQLPGRHCTSFNRQCQFYEKFCTAHVHPPIDTPSVGLQPGDPANKIIPYLPVDVRDPNVVIMSYSAFSNESRCSELYRLSTMEGMPGEESDALDFGTAFHAGVAAVNKTIRKVSI